ncbi:hypothetical protein [Xenorhabdus cabanillasii]|uniref:Uncharacterized protein n=1 Tax=Xenorhabdus cabanillasii TaxID=351673 RepID=A0A3D9UP43_9GAMM|nr:hypothetical protein [Xenorhabdus cabanillasii]PHM77405.1 hypothetical protein Xcab_01977 [Xenorhabdus cabanillasii JM26]REF28415.1 hypothetical protein BDD26_3315 [Xenorhabdus cabanillasii]
MERTFYNNSEVDMLIYLGATDIDSSGIVHESEIARKYITPKQNVSLYVTGGYISRFDVIIERGGKQPGNLFSMALRVLEQEQKIAVFFKYEKFVLNFNRINETDPNSPESFQFSIIPMI